MRLKFDVVKMRDDKIYWTIQYSNVQMSNAKWLAGTYVYIEFFSILIDEKGDSDRF